MCIMFSEKKKNILRKLFYHMTTIIYPNSMSSKIYESTNYNHIG
jgi:hypothetical protein